ncbi:2259_t:CDS:1, partial [Cetraspora pellucida]
MSFNQNLQNSTPISNTLIHSDENFVIELSSDFNKETNAEGTKELFFKCGKNVHPIWNYFKPTSDKKFILCNLCSETKYSIGT